VPIVPDAAPVSRVAVVGGGAIGASTAWRVAEAVGGVAEVLLLEADVLASGSTGRAVGEVETQYLERDDIGPRVRSMEILSDLERRGRLTIHRNGYLRLARSLDAMVAMERGLAIQRDLGVDSAQIVTVPEISRLVPGINTSGLAGGLLGRADGHVDPNGLAHAFAQLAQESGATIREHAPVAAVSLQEGAQHRVTLRSGECVMADVVVNAAGSWAGQLNSTAGIDAPVTGYRHQVATFEIAADYPDIPFVMDFLPGSPENGIYFRKEGERRLLAGLHDDHLDPAGATDPDHCPTGVDPGFVESVVARLAALLPGLADRIAYVDGWSGLYPFTPSAKPLIEDVRNAAFIMAIGFGGVGIQLSPWAGVEVASLVVAALTRRGMAGATVRGVDNSLERH
jgi:sarcosine oxidase subunit beta